MNKTYLLLGSNIGDSIQQLLDAERYIEKNIGNIELRSALFNTAAWGKKDQPDFVNQVLLVKTSLTAFETMAMILHIEAQMGRVRTEKNAPRIIDIDILFFNNEIIKTADLVIPHPFIQQRMFVLVPLNELSPLLVHPVLNKTVAQLLKECTDELGVNKI